jgi:hypothetical protein
MNAFDQIEKLIERIDGLEKTVEMQDRMIRQLQQESTDNARTIRASFNVTGLRLRHPYGTRGHELPEAMKSLEMAERTALRKFGLVGD